MTPWWPGQTTARQEGSPNDASTPVQWPDGGWTVEPDVVVDLPPYPVSAKAVVEWESILIPGPFKEDTWVTSVQILPGDPSVVHHMCFEFQEHNPELPFYVYEWAEIPRKEDGDAKVYDGTVHPTEGTILRRAVGSTEVSRFQGEITINGSNQFCYLPGLTLEDYRPVNGGVFVPAGTVMAVDVHYTTTGKATVDKTRIGFTIAKTPPTKEFINLGDGDDEDFPVESRIQDNTKLAIPPNDANYYGPPAEITFKKDTELVWFPSPRARACQERALHLDLSRRPRRDRPRCSALRLQLAVNLQNVAEDPQGLAHAHSVYLRQLHQQQIQPDPNKWVYYGGQSWEEMGTPNMGFLVDRNTKKEDLVQ